MDEYPTIRSEQLAKETESGSTSSAPSADSIARPSSQQLVTVEWNLQELLERVEGDRAFMRELLVMFCDDSKNIIENAKDALAKRDLARLSAEAHRMKGMLKNLAMSSSADIAAALETAAQNGVFSEAEELLAKLVQSLVQMQPELDAQLVEAKA